ncbi:BLOC-1-related complex subunit 5-like isoform X2 [Halichondria panicea]|uniref:BLOC-1-related complex subunit 5-like isoform X2 n=1 Tax=Halichondria panicea TaxID=6063 RepID=UPI00312B9137
MQPSVPSDAGARGVEPNTSISSDLSPEEDSIPYTAYSQEKHGPPLSSVTQSLPAYPLRGGVTVVNTLPDASWRAAKPLELQKLDKLPRFWPILRSSLESMPPQEKISDGVQYKEILSLCIRYQEHLSEAAKIVSTEQKALASRLKDIEMFSAGIMQQMIRRQENLLRTNTHLQKVTEVEQALTKIKTKLDSCVPVVRRMNSYLPEENRLETFRLFPEVESDSEDDKSGESADSQATDSYREPDT